MNKLTNLISNYLNKLKIKFTNLINIGFFLGSKKWNYMIYNYNLPQYILNKLETQKKIFNNIK